MEVSFVEFAYKQHSPLKHLVAMQKHCEAIASFKKKLKVDPMNTQEHESLIYKHSSIVSDLNSFYQAEKEKEQL